eukprot:TRINITY_DN3810_c0_g2_i6.p1 TRINITY_DN3810_c0_g2~~TRINITY_DN3810_c0_g2_i6.p1  ORF type:complete len:357 (-),score=71.92 TRINITY_DN3810_c0_g2_i6:586-1656(-)
MISRTLLKISNSFIQLPLRFFPRNIRPAIRNLDSKDKLPDTIKAQAEETKSYTSPKLHSERSKAKRQVETNYMASQYYPVSAMPEFLVSLAQKVFPKYSVPHIKKWGYLLKQNYQRLSSCENPADITKVPPFANTDEKTGIKVVRDFKENYVKSVPLIEENTEPEVFPQEQSSSERQLFNMEYKQAHAVAYLLKKFPHTYFVLLRIFAELKKRCPEFVPLSCLDFGAGLGSGVLAATGTFPRLQKVAACEPSSPMRKLGKLATKKLPQEVLWVDSLTMIPGTGGDRGKFDMVILSEVLQEVASPAERLSIVNALWARVTESMFCSACRWNARRRGNRVPQRLQVHQFCQRAFRQKA